MFQPMLLNGAYWHEPVTENPTLEPIEIWSLINLTDDSHPIHLHLVRFQILDRRPFDLFTYLNERKVDVIRLPPFRRMRTKPDGRIRCGRILEWSPGSSSALKDSPADTSGIAMYSSTKIMK